MTEKKPRRSRKKKIEEDSTILFDTSDEVTSVPSYMGDEITSPIPASIPEAPTFTMADLPDAPTFVAWRYDAQQIEDFRKAYNKFVADYNRKRGK